VPQPPPSTADQDDVQEDDWARRPRSLFGQPRLRAVSGALLDDVVVPPDNSRMC
jgi:hypothetical protein